ncbi:MAG: hypothetical protein RLO46_07735 [Pseudomonadales bacterium]
MRRGEGVRVERDAGDADDVAVDGDGRVELGLRQRAGGGEQALGAVVAGGAGHLRQLGQAVADHAQMHAVFADQRLDGELGHGVGHGGAEVIELLRLAVGCDQHQHAEQQSGQRRRRRCSQGRPVGFDEVGPRG